MAIPKGIWTAAGLAGTAGYVNAVAYLGLHAFVAPMTGTVILVGFSLADQNWAEAGRAALVICGFVAGVTVARLLRRLGRGPAPCFIVSGTLLIASTFRPLEGLASLIPIATALGCLNGAETRFGATTLNTTFITGNLERLGEAIADREFKDRRTQMALIAGIIAAYALGATLGAVGARTVPYPLLAPAIGLIAWAIALRWTGATARQPSPSSAR